MLDYIVKEAKPDVIFWTGDNSSHNVWDNTNEEVTSYTVTVSQMIHEKLDGTDITVIPIQGNHDTWPCDVESFEAPGVNYPINHFKEYWADWLGDAALEKFGEYGYYSMDLNLKNGKAVPHGTVVIALNTNACNSHNWYLLGQRTDPGG